MNVKVLSLLELLLVHSAVWRQESKAERGGVESGKNIGVQGK